MKKVKKLLRKFFIFLFLRNLMFSLKSKKLFNDLGNEFRFSLLRRKCLRIKNIRKKIFLFYPGFPCPGYFLYQVVRVLGMKISNDPDREFDLAIDWRVETTREKNDVLETLALSHRVLNVGCKDISKANVEKVFKEVFGYGTFVDPSKFNGYAVRKSNDNAMHDGKSIKCPVPAVATDGFVFQRLINNAVDKDRVLDLRVYIVGKNIPFVCLTFRSSTNRFDNILEYRMCAPQEVFNEIEIEKILLFCQKMGLEYGELDVLRDEDDRKIYIIDANNTPYGNDFALNRKEGERVLLELSKSFYEEFFNV